jgi:hypothetical protein
MALAGQASAAFVDVTYTGTATGFDGGFFGSPASYVATPFTATYSFNEIDIYAGDPGGGFGSFLGADITINGHDFHLPPTGLGIYAADAAIGGYSRLSSFTLYNPSPASLPIPPHGYFYARMSNSIASPLVPQDRTDPFAATGVNTTGLVSTWNRLYFENSDLLASFAFTNESVSVLSAPSTPLAGPGVGFAAVPEPRTWALLLTGLFGLGAALRHRRFQGATA